MDFCLNVNIGIVQQIKPIVFQDYGKVTKE